MFSKACEYAIKAMVYIATQSLENNRVKVGDIANNSANPEAFTAKIMGELKRAHLVDSFTGPNGGFEIDIQKMKQIKVSEIVFAIDGDNVYKGCALGLEACNPDEPCPLHEKFASIRENLKQMLETTSIYELAVQFQSGKTTLIR
ncbi:MAG TPA: Rrf2 family transcriptional regulator [Edaphocola sp.]|nr:Rrf2 family transcriptional regulator [Edaphocola sp.]